MSQPTIGIIRGKTCYWGRHTIEASDDDTIRLDIYTNCPKKWLTSIHVSTKRSLMDEAERLPHDIIGSLGTKHTPNTVTKNGHHKSMGMTEPKVDYFLKSFR